MYQLFATRSFNTTEFLSKLFSHVNYWMTSFLPFDFCISAKLAMNSKEALSTFWLPWSFLVDSSVGLAQCWMRSKLSFSQWNTWEWCWEEALNIDEKFMTINGKYKMLILQYTCSLHLIADYLLLKSSFSHQDLLLLHFRLPLHQWFKI